MDMAMLNYIPFWIQIRGIPLQYMNRPVIVNIARVLGEYIQMDYNEEVGSKLEFLRVCLNWNINNPLKFQRNFQFNPGVNTLLRIQYERLRGFCEMCGLITHDSGACQIQNGGTRKDDGGNDSGGEDADIELIPNHDVIIEEINEGEEEGEAAANAGAEGANMEAEAEPVDPEQEEYEMKIREWEEENDDDQLWSGDGMQMMFSSEMEMREMYNPLHPYGQHIPKETSTESVLRGKLGSRLLQITQQSSTEVKRVEQME